VSIVRVTEIGSLAGHQSESFTRWPRSGIRTDSPQVRIRIHTSLIMSRRVVDRIADHETLEAMFTHLCTVNLRGISLAVDRPCHPEGIRYSISRGSDSVGWRDTENDRSEASWAAKTTKGGPEKKR